MDGKRPQWIGSVAAYTVGGLATSVIVGGAVGAAGGALPVAAQSAATVLALAALGVGIARGLGWKDLQLPRRGRQTEGSWLQLFPLPVAATMWGLHIGLAFRTPVTFSATGPLAALALAGGDVWFGAALFSAYWLGRVLPVWLAPFLLALPDASPTLNAIRREKTLFARLNMAALAWSAAWLIADTLANPEISQSLLSPA